MSVFSATWIEEDDDVIDNSWESLDITEALPTRSSQSSYLSNLWNWATTN